MKLVVPIKMKSKKQHTKTGLPCAYCDKEFKYESERKRHEISHCPQFECKVCDKKFSFLSAVRRHEKQHQRTGNVVCDECNRKFRDETLLKRHIKYAHRGAFTCSKCEVTFSSDQALRSHAKTHKPASERRFRCRFPSCEKTFNFTHHLKHHELTHTNTKQHYCNVCGKGFIQAHHLKSHKKWHEPENWLKCDFPSCRTTFTTEYAKKRHLATHSRNIKPEDDSSDMNSSCDITDLIEPDTVVCKSCKQVLLRQHYADHLSNCFVKKEMKNIVQNTHIQEDLPKLELVKIDFQDDIDTSTCKSYIGGCIVGEDPNGNEKCLCAQLSAPTEESYELKHNVGQGPRQDVVYQSGVCDIVKINDTTDDSCSACKCSCNLKSCFDKTKEKNENNKNKDTLPKMEYKIDGTIRIEETFDFDLQSERTEEKTDPSEMVPYNSCRDVLGNCIVSGNGTIGDGCLCARMAIDDQQMRAQEIDELTPCPKIQ